MCYLMLLLIAFAELNLAIAIHVKPGLGGLRLLAFLLLGFFLLDEQVVPILTAIFGYLTHDGKLL